MSRLRTRLAALHQQRGVPTPVAEATTLAERIRRARPTHSPTNGLTPGQDDRALAEQVAGSLVAPGVIRITSKLPLTEHHGVIPLLKAQQPIAHLPVPEAGVGPDWLFFDTETTGLAGGSGTLAFLIGFARVRDRALQVEQYLLTTFAAEQTLLRTIAGQVAPGATLVSFNGKSYDAPLMATRCRLNGVDIGLHALPHVDLLYPLRTAYAGLWPDCRLCTAEQRLLEFNRVDDLPGAQAPQAWFDYVQRGDAARLVRVVEHNHWDLVSLAALLPALDEAFADPLRWRANTTAIARAHARRGATDQARRLIAAAGRDGDERAGLAVAKALRREGDLNAARSVWHRLAQQGSALACEQLAKHYEHVERDYARALDFAQRLPNAPSRQQRQQRLQRKLGLSRC